MRRLHSYLVKEMGTWFHQDYGSKLSGGVVQRGSYQSQSPEVLSSKPTEGSKWLTNKYCFEI